MDPDVDVDANTGVTWAYAAKISEPSRHAEVSSKKAGVSCQSFLHLDNGCRDAMKISE